MNLPPTGFGIRPTPLQAPVGKASAGGLSSQTEQGSRQQQAERQNPNPFTMMTTAVTKAVAPVTITLTGAAQAQTPTQVQHQNQLQTQVQTQLLGQQWATGGFASGVGQAVPASTATMDAYWLGTAGTLPLAAGNLATGTLMLGLLPALTAMLAGITAWGQGLSRLSKRLLEKLRRQVLRLDKLAPGSLYTLNLDPEELQELAETLTPKDWWA